MKVEVAVLSSPVPNSPYGLCGRKATLNCQGRSEHRSCVTVELSDPTLKLRSCVKVEMTVLGSLSLIVHTVCVDVKQH